MSWKNAATTMRQTQLVRAGGPGSLAVLKEGLTVLLPGIDTWYLSRDSKKQEVPDEARVTDALLASNLGVDFFVAPPADGVTDDKDHLDAVLGVTLFPKWVVCNNSSCGYMMRLGDANLNLPYCPECAPQSKRKGWRMVQTNFLVSCEEGHLDEFPWLDWVHRGSSSHCAQPKLRFRAMGIAELGKQRVECSCGAKRDLGRTNAVPDEQGSEEKLPGMTFLSKKLADSGEPYLCSGAKPWLHVGRSDCSQPIRMLLRNQNNLYFPSVSSSILVPESAEASNPIRETILESNYVNSYKGRAAAGKTAQQIAIRAQDDISQLEHEPLDEITAVMGVLIKEWLPVEHALENDGVVSVDRSPEWEALRKPVESKNLIVRATGWAEAENSPGIDEVLAVQLLHKTSALMGFSRINSRSISGWRGRSLIQRNAFAKGKYRWLPGVQHRGEGIFVIVNSNSLAEWEKSPAVQSRYGQVVEHVDDRDNIPRFVLLHTFAHLLIQQLVFECGYTSASLGERIFSEGNQAGFLIYTASQSGDGTMGGLVEMSEPSRFQEVIQRALTAADWCSNDPICMDVGTSSAGGKDSILAACHNCCFLPETACDHRNMGLDRAALIGDFSPTAEALKFF